MYICINFKKSDDFSYGLYYRMVTGIVCYLCFLKYGSQPKQNMGCEDLVDGLWRPCGKTVKLLVVQPLMNEDLEDWEELIQLEYIKDNIIDQMVHLVEEFDCFIRSVGLFAFSKCSLRSWKKLPMAYKNNIELLHDCRRLLKRLFRTSLDAN